MTSPVTVIGRALLCLAAAAVWCGCEPTATSQGEEEKEPHYLAGKARVSEMDYAGAIASFEKAVEANPRSASAHFELASLCEQHAEDPAGAIYHFERYLRLRASPENEETVRSRIDACKKQLARSVALGPVAQNWQMELEKLSTENQRLREEVYRWRALSTAREQARVTTNRTVTPSTVVLRAVAPGTPTSTTIARATRGTSGDSVSQTPASPQVARVVNRGVSARSYSGRNHAVRPGETLSSIARKYGVRVTSVIAANPGLDERRLRVGQPLMIPAA